MGVEGLMDQESPDKESGVIERDIDPKIIGHVLEKVVDIFESGYGITTVRGEFAKQIETTDELKSTLEKGLLGLYTFGKTNAEGTLESKEMSKGVDIVERWKQLMKERTGVVFGNIIGKDVGVGEVESLERYHAGTFAILFDLIDKQEVFPGDIRVATNRPKKGPDERDISSYDKALTTKSNQYWARQSVGVFSTPTLGGLISSRELRKLLESGIFKGVDTNTLPFPMFVRMMEKNKENLESAGIDASSLLVRIKGAQNYTEAFGAPLDEEGYVLGRRIAPRRFRGVVLDQTEDTERKTSLDNVRDAFDKTGMYLPVYDISGNLLWPVKMSRQEIQESEKTKRSDSTNNESV
jgi:hypothetical protein